MTLHRALAGALLGIAVAMSSPVAAANAAAPADYPPGADVSLSLSATVVAVGAPVTVSGAGFQAGSTVSVTTGRAGQGFAARDVDAAAAALDARGPAGASRPSAQGFALVGVRADGAGSFRTTVSFGSVGSYVVTASGLAADGTAATASASVTVIAAGGGVGGEGSDDGSGNGAGDGNGSGGGSASGVGGSGSLPDTGASIGLPLIAGTILVLVGATMVTVFRRRHGNAAA